MSLLVFCLVYVVFGFAILLMSVSVSRFQDKDEKEHAHAQYRDEKATTFGEIVLKFILAPVVAISLIVLGWPVLTLLGIQEYLNPTTTFGEPVFCVEKEHLGNPVDIRDVEAKEMVFDPLFAVPHLPFGHLNTAWRNFVSQIAEGDELWTFSSVWQHQSIRELRSGYVIVNSDASIGQFFMTQRSLEQPKSA